MFCGVVHFKRPYPRYPKTLLLAYLVQRYAHLVHHAESPHFLGLANFKRPHPKHPKTVLVASLVQRYVRLGRRAATPQKCAVGSGVALQTPIPLEHDKPEKVFLETWDECL